MISGDPNVESVELVAAALGEVCEEVVLVGGCAASLLIDAPSAPAFLGTKFEAFRTRGHPDMLVSHDFEDIIDVLEGRRRIVEEIGGASPALKCYLSAAFEQVMATLSSVDTLPGLAAIDELHEQGVSAVLQRLRAVAAMQCPSAG